MRRDPRMEQTLKTFCVQGRSHIAKEGRPSAKAISVALAQPVTLASRLEDCGVGNNLKTSWQEWPLEN